MKHRIATIAIFSLLLTYSPIAKAEEQIELENIGSWQNVVSFHINRTEDHLVMTMLNPQGQEQAYEAFKHSGVWGKAVPIDEINSQLSEQTTIGGLFLTDNEERIYFHANFPNGVGGYDIYFCKKTADGWSDPQLEPDLSTTDNETFPTITNGGNTIYLLRHRVVSNQRQEKKEVDKQSIYFAEKNAQNKWSRLLPVNNALNIGWVQDVCILGDGKTMYYSLRPERKEPSVLMYTRATIAGEWYLPEPLFIDEAGYDYFSPNYAGEKIYAIRSNNKKRIRSGSIVSTKCPDKYKILDTINEIGEIKSKDTHKPIEASINIYNPTTSAVLGRYTSTSFDGTFDITNLANANYIVDVRSKGYSYASYQLNYKDSPKAQMPKSIELFDTIHLNISIYDAEIFRPLKGKVIAVRQNDKAIFRSVNSADGQYLLSLPIGSDYNIIANSNGFDENKFLFKLAGDIVYSRFERNMPLNPQKKNIKVNIFDAETKAPLNANISFENRKREENVKVQAKNMTNGQVNVALRYFDEYELTVSGVANYSFHNRYVDVQKIGDNIDVFLIPLRANTAIQLNNINFATGSAEIMPESYPELERVAKLLKENRGLKFEIAAHTDNVGAANYNMLLSERRAQAVTDYLIEIGVEASMLVAKGYGLTKPIVPNTSEENRAQNRRVEFKILADE